MKDKDIPAKYKPDLSNWILQFVIWAIFYRPLTILFTISIYWFETSVLGAHVDGETLEAQNDILEGLAILASAGIAHYMGRQAWKRKQRKLKDLHTNNDNHERELGRTELVHRGINNSSPDDNLMIGKLVSIRDGEKQSDQASFEIKTLFQRRIFVIWLWGLGVVILLSILGVPILVPIFLALTIFALLIIYTKKVFKKS